MLLEDQVTDLSSASAGVTVAVSVWVLPTVKEMEVLSKLTPVTLGFTVTAQLAVLAPSWVVTVITAVPAFLATMAPEDVTVATVSLSEAQVTSLSVAVVGETVAVSVWVSPSDKVKEVLFRETPVTGTLTVTEQDAVLPPSLVVTVIVALPPAFAVTTPVAETVATEVLLEDQVTDLSVASDGETVAVRVRLSPATMVKDIWSRLTPVTGMTTVTLQVAVLPPSLVVTVIVVVPAAFAVTTPVDETVATDVLPEDQATDLSDALDGETVAVSV